MVAEISTFDLAGCLKRVRRNDQDAARMLVEHLYPLVMRIVHRNLPRRVQAEDLAQEVFLKMFSRLGQYQGAVPFTHWVSRIAVTTCIDQLRSQKRRPEFRWADLSEDEANFMESIATDEDEVSPADAVAASDLADKLMSQLRPDDRKVIRLLDLEQKTIAEISGLTGWSIAVVKTRAFRARKKLNVLFQELQREEESTTTSSFRIPSFA